MAHECIFAFTGSFHPSLFPSEVVAVECWRGLNSTRQEVFLNTTDPEGGRYRGCGAGVRRPVRLPSIAFGISLGFREQAKKRSLVAPNTCFLDVDTRTDSLYTDVYTERCRISL